MAEYNEKLCAEKHKGIDEKLNEHEERLNGHDTEINNLQVKEGVHSTQIDQLCKSIDGLVSTNKWLIGLIGTSLVGFFFYAIQQHLFK